MAKGRKRSVMSKVSEILVYDNRGGSDPTYDHYTVAVVWKGLEPEETDILFFGDNDLGAYSGTLEDAASEFYDEVLSGRGGLTVGIRVPWDKVPKTVRHNIEERIEGFEGSFFEEK